MFLGWMYDVAREQSPPLPELTQMLRRTAAAGYAAIGLYLEHRFAYPSAPWAAAPGCVTGDMVAAARRASGTVNRLRVIPFLNTLGHMEGFIRAEGGQWLAEGPPVGGVSVQMCASRPECIGFARGLVEDTLAAFDDEWVHLGGDETRQLGQCPLCAERVAASGRGGLYAEFYGPLCRFVLERGRRPCLWADMLLQHPEALDAVPRETVLFDWQYFQRPLETTRRLRERGFDVVCCPSVQSWNAGWCFLDATCQNIDEHAADARAAGAYGVCVTTWNLTHFSTYAGILPLVYAAGRRLARGEAWEEALITEGGPGYARAAGILGRDIPACAAFLAPGTWRRLREHLVMRLDPFSLWSAWRSEATSPVGDAILECCRRAELNLRDDDPLRLAVELHRAGVLWVRAVERAAVLYATADHEGCANELGAGAAALALLRPHLAAAAERGGSAADLHRLDILLRRVCDAQRRVRTLVASGRPAYRPAFEVLIGERFVLGDQAAWDGAGLIAGARNE